MDIYRKEITKEISLVSDKAKLLFAALTSERLQPNYQLFQKLTGWGDFDVLREGVALIYQSLIKEDLFSIAEIEHAIEEVDSITPDTEDFPGITTSFALDACTSVYSSLNYLLDKNLDHIVDVAVYARDTVDMFIQEKYDLSHSDPQIESKIATDPLMVAEKKRQKELLHKLRSLDVDVLTDAIIESLRDRTPIIELDALN